MSNPPSASTDKPGFSGRLAFILDDEPQIRAIACRILESIGLVARQFAAPLPMLD